MLFLRNLARNMTVIIMSKLVQLRMLKELKNPHPFAKIGTDMEVWRL